MKEIDQMLDQWIHSSIIRAKLKGLIMNAIAEANKSGYIAGNMTNHKLNTNEDG